MADHYLQFSFKVPLTFEQIKETELALVFLEHQDTDWRLGAAAEEPDEALENLDFHKVFPHIKTDPGANVKKTAMALYAHLAHAIDDPKDLDAVGMCPSLSGLSFEAGPREFFIFSTGNGNVEGAVALISAMQERFAVDPMGFSYAQYCSKPRPDEFHGGSVWVDNGKVDWMHTSEWLGEKKDALRKKNQAQANATQTDSPAPEATP